MDEVPAAARVGTAGWSIPRLLAGRFPGEGSHLERYARVLRCAEINSTFYRSSRPETYARWALSTPEDFRFSVKMPKAITHAGLVSSREPMQGFLSEIAALGSKLGPVLMQLPPKQTFEVAQARAFLTMFRDQCPDGAAVMEPRHASWFGPEAEEMLREFRVGRVAADPAPVRTASVPGGWPGLVYHRLHGSPRVYYSGYEAAFLDELAAELRRQAAAGAEVWCVFDNTASGAAAGDALGLVARL